MENKQERPSDRVIEYVETMIMTGKLQMNDRLPTERDLAKMLGVSRTAVREGIHLLEISGIIECRQGSGNYITSHFDQTLERVLTMMYVLEDLKESQIREFRYVAERQALTLAVGAASEQDRTMLLRYLDGMLNGRTEEEKVENDRMLHQHLVQMSGNRLIIANYNALTRIIERSIREMRRKIEEECPDAFETLRENHEQLVNAVLDGNIERAGIALKNHYLLFQKVEKEP